MATATPQSAWTAWVWAVFAFNTLFSTIFAILCWFTFSAFTRVSNDPSLPLPGDVRRQDWISLFDGAAVSAFFAVMLVGLFVVLSVYYMVLSRRALAHPRNKYGKGVLVATSLFTALHVANIATQFLTFTNTMRTWVRDYHASFNPILLTATWVFGYLSSVFFLIFLWMIMLWRDKGAEALEHQALQASAA